MEDIIDYIAAPINWETGSTVARKCCAHNLTDHWSVLSHLRLPERKGQRHHRNSNAVVKGWKPKTESDECGFGRVIVGSLEASEDVMGEVSSEDITECFPRAASAVDFESAVESNRLVKKTAEHLEAGRNLSGKLEKN